MTKSTEIGGQNNAADAEDVTKLDDLQPERRRKVITMGADIEALENQHKIARYRDFEFHCDEPAWLGGEDRHPQPLTYVAAGVGF